MATEKIELTVPEEYHLERVDRFLTGALEADLSRSYIQKLIKAGDITVNGEAIRQNYKIKTDDVIAISIPEPTQLDVLPEDIALDIVYQDADIAVINKRPGLVVHPGPGNWSGTMVNGLLYHLKDLSSIGGSIRPGIVHRLDKDTAGLMVVAKNDAAHRALTEQFAERRVKKMYDAIVIGKPDKGHDVIDRPIGRHPKYRHKMCILESGRDAVTEYTLKKIYNTSIGLFSRVEILLHTGRTHQIRVHLSSMGNPIVADPVYSKKASRFNVPYLMLAARHLEFTHPASGETVSFRAALPEHMEKFLNKLESLEG
ncbi:MAG: RluA family pseudouridine synthase [Spirochaetes bacterium]|nr:RluA family pseudouridine synthase [Spirochaetota bacterium]